MCFCSNAEQVLSRIYATIIVHSIVSIDAIIISGAKVIKSYLGHANSIRQFTFAYYQPFRPGLAGGYCIGGVDPYFFKHKADMLGFDPQMILAGSRIHDGSAAYLAKQTVKKIIQSGVAVKGSKVIVLELTFKENCIDLRNSKVAVLVKELQEFVCRVSVHNPLAEPADAMHE